MINLSSFHSVITGTRVRMLIVTLWVMATSLYATKVNLNYFIGNEKIKVVTVDAGIEYTLSELIPTDSVKNVSECRNYSFQGWKIGSPIKGDEIPTPATTVRPVANVNLYGIFNTGTVNHFDRIYSVDELKDDADYLIVSYHIYGGEKNYYALNCLTGSYVYQDFGSWGKLGGTRVWPQDDVIYDPEETCIWNFTESTSTTPSQWRITIADAFLFVGSNYKYWMLQEPASGATKTEITSSNGEFTLKMNFQYSDHIYADTIVNQHDTVLGIDSLHVIAEGDTVFYTHDSTWYDTVYVEDHKEYYYQTWYLNYVPDEISAFEDFFITDTIQHEYPIYLYKRANAFTSYPNCQELTSHYDAVEGYLHTTGEGCTDYKKTDVVGEYWPGGGGWQKGFYADVPQACLPGACGTEWSFAGWAMEEPVKPTRFRPTLQTDHGYIRNGQLYNNERLYAVYAKGVEYIRVTDTTQLHDGDACLLVSRNTHKAVQVWKADPGWWWMEDVVFSESGDTILSVASKEAEFTFREYDRVFINGTRYFSENERYAEPLKIMQQYPPYTFGHKSTRDVGITHWLSYDYYGAVEGYSWYYDERESGMEYGDSKTYYWDFNVYRKEGGVFNKITSMSDLNDGDILVFVMYDMYAGYPGWEIGNKAVKDQGYGYCYEPASVTVSGDQITGSVSDKAQWTFRASDSTLWNVHYPSNFLGSRGDMYQMEPSDECLMPMKHSGKSYRFWLKSGHTETYDCYKYFTWRHTYGDDWFLSPSHCGSGFSWSEHKNTPIYRDVTGVVEDENVFFDIYKKSDDATYSSYPHCAPYSVNIHACGGTIDGTLHKTDSTYVETGIGLGFTLPSATPDCPDEGWEFVGWFPDEDKESFEMTEFKDFYPAGTVYIPQSDGANLYAIYKRKTDKFKILQGNMPNQIVDGDEYLITYYTRVNGSLKVYDFEISGIKYNSTYLSSKQGESPQNGEGYYMIESDPNNIWIINKTGQDMYSFRNMQSNQYLVLGKGSSKTQAAVNSVYVFDAGKGFEVNLCCKVTSSSYWGGSSSTYYAAYCDTYGRWTTTTREYKSNRYQPFSYVYRRVKEYSSWPHCDPFTVHFDVCGGVLEADSAHLTEPTHYAGVTAPEAQANLECAKLGWQFAGWAKNPVYVEADRLTFDMVPANSNYIPVAKNDTLYAVYQQKTDQYNRIRKVTDLYTGGNYIIATAPNAGSGSANKALANTVGSASKTLKSVNISLEPGDSVVINENANIVWRFAGRWGEYVLYNPNRKVYFDMSEPGELYLQPGDSDQVDITFNADNNGFIFRSVQNIGSNDQEAKFLGHNGTNFIAVQTGTSNQRPLALYRQQCYYQSYPNCVQEIAALYWEKLGSDVTDYFVTVESYELKKEPDMHSSMGFPVYQGDGTFQIQYHHGMLPPCSKALVTWGGKTAELHVPYIVSEKYTDSDTLFKANVCDSCDVYVMPGCTLRVNDDHTVRILTLHDSAKLIVEADVRLRVQQMALFSEGDRITPLVISEGAGEHAGQIELKNGELYLDRRIDDKRWYWFSLPYDAKMSEVNYANEDANCGKPRYNYQGERGYFINYYDGAQRAADCRNGELQDTYWRRFTGDTLIAGVGYQVGIYDQGDVIQKDGRKHTKRVLRFVMRPDGYLWNSLENDKAKSAPVTASDVTHDFNYSYNAVHAGWNLIGNPYLNTYHAGSTSGASGLRNGTWTQEWENGEWTERWVQDTKLDNSIPYLTVYNPFYRRYVQVLASDYEWRPGEAVFVQILEGNRVGFGNATSVSNMPRRNSASSATNIPLRTGIQLSGNNQTDQTGVVLSDAYSLRYEIGADLLKSKNSGELNLYSINTESQPLAFIGLSDNDATNPIPLGVTFPAAGQYTFSFDSKHYYEEDLEMLVLIDKKLNTKTDLLHGKYNVTIDKATTVDNRFQLLVRRAKRTTTDIEVVPGSNGANDPNNIDGSEQGVEKFFKDGVLYIRRNGQVYDSAGKPVEP